MWLPREPDPRGPCSNDDCPRCYPDRKWFKVSTVTVEVRDNARTLMTETAETAMAEYDQGTPWPTDYDSTIVQTLETRPTTVTQVGHPHVVDIGGRLFYGGYCFWDLEPDGANGLSQEQVDALMESDD